MLEAERWLQHGNRPLPDSERFWTLEERSTDEWIARYQDTMKLLAGWKEEEEASADTHYWLVAQAYSMLARLIPPGPARENAMGVYLNFLETRYTAVKSRNLWFVWVRDLLDCAPKKDGRRGSGFPLPGPEGKPGHPPLHQPPAAGGEEVALKIFLRRSLSWEGPPEKKIEIFFGGGREKRCGLE